jgi:hypothetical protein
MRMQTMFSKIILTGVVWGTVLLGMPFTRGGRYCAVVAPGGTRYLQNPLRG